MSANLPFRTIRIPRLQRQCLFQHHRHLQPLRAFTTTTPQLFTSTSSRGKAPTRQDRTMTKATTKHHVGPAPLVSREEAEREAGSDMAEDIGLLQDTIIRASSDKLPHILSLRRWVYYWKFVKSKATGLYSRISYNQCMLWKGKWRYLPVDTMEGNQLRGFAENFYRILYKAFAERDSKTITRFCLAPLAQDFKHRIATRGPLSIKWKFVKLHSARVVSHRASQVGEHQPNTAYRQAVVRLVSTQIATWESTEKITVRLPTTSDVMARKRSKWVPEDAKGVVEDEEEDKESRQFADHGVAKEVVEYIVLQRRVIDGREDDKWKVWGFAQESTPEKLAEDEAYWRKVLELQTAAS